MTLDISVQCVNLGKAPVGSGIDTGMGFFNHMLDQFNSHAQIGLSATVVSKNDDDATANIQQQQDDNHKMAWENRASQENQSPILQGVGQALGCEIRRLLQESSSSSLSSTFDCPLDEALVQCTLLRLTDNEPSGQQLQYQNFVPLGKYNRQYIGHLHAAALPHFWQSVATHAQLDITLTCLRGDNAHHVVEASFKAFCRALRNLIDGVDTIDTSSSTAVCFHNDRERNASTSRNTKETSIQIDLSLPTNATANNTPNDIAVHTGIPALDVFWTELATAARWSRLHIQCAGDVWIDEHHTAEDVAIAMGQCVHQALANKAGLNRMWSASSDNNDAVRAVVDISNRPCAVHDWEYTDEFMDGERLVGAGFATANGPKLSTEMWEHVLESFVVNARWTVHLVTTSSNNDKRQPSMQATARALGRAIYYTASIDPRRAGQTASSKGTLSV